MIRDSWWRFSCRHLVCTPDDPGRAARVVYVDTNTVRVRWLDTGWRSEFEPAELELFGPSMRAEDAHNAACIKAYNRGRP